MLLFTTTKEANWLPKNKALGIPTYISIMNGITGCLTVRDSTTKLIYAK